MTASETIRVRVDPCNPGQFLACCGLLELADRLWPGAEGWFEENFTTCCISSHGAGAVLLEALATCTLSNTMTPNKVRRREELNALGPKGRSPEMEAEKKLLDAQWRKEPILLHSPFHLRIDWWYDEYTGGSGLKTWAGQQSVTDIVRTMRRPIEQGQWRNIAPVNWLMLPGAAGVPFNFDSDLGSQSSDLDIGFSLDPLGLGQRTRPLIELGAFVGLQRFRPAYDPQTRTFNYTLWPTPLPPEVAAVAACGSLALKDCRSFSFRLLYRTAYLKSFLPAKPIGDRP